LVAALAASPFYYRRVYFRVEEEVRARVETKIAEHFPHLEVRVRSAHLMGDGIEIRGVSIAEPDAVGPQPQLVYLDEVFLTCQTSLQELLAGEPRVTAVKVSRPVVHATRRPDGGFSLARLLPLPERHCAPPSTTIDSGVIEIFDPLKNPSSTLTLRDVNLTIKPTNPLADGPVPLDIQGYLVADQIQRVEIVGTLEPAAARWSLSGTVDGLEISPELLSALPQRLSDPLAPLAAIRAPATFSFRARGDDFQSVPRFEVNGSVTRGRVEHSLLPYPLADLQAMIHLDNSGIRVRDLKARHGATTWEVSHFESRGFERDAPFTLDIVGRQVRFDRGWGDALSEPWRTDWRNYDPEGEVDLECKLSFDGKKFHPTARVTCGNNVSFSCHRFPYRLDHARGTLSLAQGSLRIDLEAFGGSQPVSLKGTFANPGANYSGLLEIRAEKIPFDEKLFAALLKPKNRENLRSLNPRGNFNVHAKVWREPNDPLPHPQMHEWAQITVNRCSINYDKFPYPLSNVQGVLELKDDLWSFGGMTGANGPGTVTCRVGRLDTRPGSEHMTLGLHGENISLSNELRDALPPNHGEAWNSLQPYGSINFDVVVSRSQGMTEPTVDLDVQPRGDATSLRTSIQPIAFPYRMEIHGGAMHYHDGHIEFKDLQAEHRTTSLRTSGGCDITHGQGWRLTLNKLDVQQARLQGEDPELIAALPKPLKRAVAELRPTGPINLKGTLQFAKHTPQEPVSMAWDVELFLNRASLQVGPKLENIFGSVQLAGTSDGTRYASHGTLKVNSLTYKNFQFIDVLGPFWFDSENVFFGTLPPQIAGKRSPGRVTAQLFGGIVALDCFVKLGATPQYHLLATVSGADLGQFARENLATHQKLSGKVLANVDVRGGRGAHNLVGRGTVRLSDADLYELPGMVSLLKIIRAKAPDSTAFTESDIDFELNGEHVALRRIDLRGDAVNLSGEGELTLDGATNPVNLELHTMVGRGNLPLISSVLSSTSQQIMTIHVLGPLDRPELIPEAFPAANQALERLRGDYDRPANVAPPPSAAVTSPRR
jgi:hypothetical protein